jgi:HAD superfamily phosphoserine phosphatase-like hydrolase
VPDSSTAHSILVTDFDGTLTPFDFYAAAVHRYCAPGGPDYWSLYASGKITHFEAMRGIFGRLRCGAPEMERVLAEIAPPAGLAAAFGRLRAAGWDILVVSNGCHWYIDRVLAAAGVEAEVVASPGSFVPGEGLLIEPPLDSPFFAPALGIDKAAVVRAMQPRYERVAFAGNGPPDLPAALLTPPDLLFARTWLAAELTRRGRGYRNFEQWPEIAAILDRTRG